MSDSTALNSNSSNLQQKFDYDSLHTETSLFVLQQTEEIRAIVKRAAQDIAIVGQKLIDVKARLGHGNFLRWLEVEFQWSWDTAKRFMRVAEVFGENQQFADFHFAPSVLYILAAPSTPKAARDEALTLAKQGERITYKMAQTLKQKYKMAAQANTLKPKSRTDKRDSVSNRVNNSTANIPKRSLSNMQMPSQSRLQLLTPATAPAAEIPTLPEENIKRKIVRKSALPSSQQHIHRPIGNSIWWQLGEKHLLYCGEPDSPEFVGYVGQETRLLLIFPPSPTWRSRSQTWQPNIPFKTLFATSEYLPKDKNLTQLDAVLESNILFYTDLWSTIVVCFLPSPEILSIINRVNRRSIVAEPDSKRCRAAITDWKGLQVERR